MRKVTMISTAACLLAGVAIFASVVLAQDNAKPKQDWSKLQVVTYSSGLTGFFDPDTGKLFVYDSNLENCVIVRQITQLGEPMTKLKN